MLEFHSLPKLTSSRLPQYHRNTVVRHGSSPSVDSEKDGQSFMSDTPGERAIAIPLEQIAAVYQPEEGRHVFMLEVSYLDKELGQGCSINLQLNDAASRDVWLRSLRKAANNARLRDMDPIPPRLSEYAARAVERAQDYDVSRYKIYKVVKRASPRTNNRSSNEDSFKVTPTVCFLVIGIHKVHLIVIPKNPLRQSSPALTDLNDAASFGVLTLTWVFVSDTDDSFSLAFR